jgi:hypothetical protein
MMTVREQNSALTSDISGADRDISERRYNSDDGGKTLSR